MARSRASLLISWMVVAMVRANHRYWGAGSAHTASARRSMCFSSSLSVHGASVMFLFGCISEETMSVDGVASSDAGSWSRRLGSCCSWQHGFLFACDCLVRGDMNDCFPVRDVYWFHLRMNGFSDLPCCESLMDADVEIDAGSPGFCGQRRGSGLISGRSTKGQPSNEPQKVTTPNRGRLGDRATPASGLELRKPRAGRKPTWDREHVRFHESISDLPLSQSIKRHLS